MGWSPIPIEEALEYFSEEELNSLGYDLHHHSSNGNKTEIFSQPRVCSGLPRICCLGSLSSGGSVFWDNRFCDATTANYFQRYVPQGQSDVSEFTYL